MAESTENLVLEILRRIQGDLADIKSRITNNGVTHNLDGTSAGGANFKLAGSQRPL